MACGCRKRGSSSKFLWYDPTNPEGVEPMVYTSEVVAKAKVQRKGGTYIPYDANASVGAQIAAAEARKV